MKTGATKDKATKALVPKLRFPEFSGQWSFEPLPESVASPRNARTPRVNPR